MLDFRDEIKKNKELAANDLDNVNYDFIEFDRMSVKGTNDASSIRDRLRILEDFIWKPKNMITTKLATPVKKSTATKKAAPVTKK